MHVFFFQITPHAMTNLSSLFTMSEFLAQASAPAQGPGGGMGPMMIVGYLLLFGAMYFFMIAPQRKKQKEHEKLISTLQSGDEIVTNGGIYGTITNVKDDRFVVRISDNTKIELAKGFVQTVLKKPEATEKK
jgi:preprotein translocase subunit YajC